MYLEKIMEQFGTGRDFKNLTILWFIEKYGIIKKAKENNLDNVGFEEYKSIVVRVMADVLKSNEKDAGNINEGILLHFVDCVMVKGVYDKKRHKFDDAFGEEVEDAIKLRGNEGVKVFTSYVINELYFDRDRPYKAKDFVDAALSLAKDIENKAAYNLRESDVYFSLLCNIVSSAEDLTAFGDEEKKALCLEYIFKALEVKETISGSKEYEGYFKNEAYVIDLNNLAYSMLQLEGPLFEFGENREFITKIYNEIEPMLINVTRDKLKALVISNLGAVQAKYGNYVNAVDYDLKALKLKQSAIIEEEKRNIEPTMDSRLTLLRTYRNIVVNSSKALLEQQFHYKLKRQGCPGVAKIAKYVRQIEIYALQAINLLIEICDYAAKKGTPSKTIAVYKSSTVRDIKPALVQTSRFLEDLKEICCTAIGKDLERMKESLDSIDNSLGVYVEAYDELVCFLKQDDIVIKNTRYKM